MLTLIKPASECADSDPFAMRPKIKAIHQSRRLFPSSPRAGAFRAFGEDAREQLQSKLSANEYLQILCVRTDIHPCQMQSLRDTVLGVGVNVRYHVIAVTPHYKISTLNMVNQKCHKSSRGDCGRGNVRHSAQV